MGQIIFVPGVLKKGPLLWSEFGAYGHGISLRLSWQSHGGPVAPRAPAVLIQTVQLRQLSTMNSLPFKTHVQALLPCGSGFISATKCVRALS